jgi:hypothetical protein
LRARASLAQHGRRCAIAPLVKRRYREHGASKQRKKSRAHLSARIEMLIPVGKAATQI